MVSRQAAAVVVETGWFTQKESDMMRAKTAWRAGALVLVLLYAGLGGCAQVDVAALQQQAAAAADAGDWVTALDLSEKCRDAAPENVTTLILQGLALFENGRPDDAIEAFGAAATVSEAFLPQLFHGWALTRCGRFMDALTPLLEAYSMRHLHPEYRANVLVLLARCCLEQKLQDGIGYLRELRSIEGYADAPELYNALGLLWLYQGGIDGVEKTQNAKENFRLALDRDPGNGIVLQNLAVLHDSYLDDPEEAMRYYRYSLKVNQELGNRIREGRIRDRLRAMTLARRRPPQEGGETR